MGKNKKALLTTAFSLLFALALTAGRKLYPIFARSKPFAYWDELSWSPADALVFVAAALAAWVACLAMVQLARSSDCRRELSYGQKRVFFSCFLLCGAVWSLSFLTFYPGTGMNDTLVVIHYGAAVGDQHPLIYSLLLSSAVKGLGSLFGSNVTGFAIVTFAQLLFQAFAVSLCAAWLAGKRPKQRLLWGYILFMALLPIYANYATALIKDSFFASLLLLLFPCLYEIRGTGGDWLQEKQMLFLMLIFLCMLIVRPSSAYLLAVLCILLALGIRACRVRALVLTILVVFIHVLFGSLSQIYPTESLGIPLQQVGAVVAHGSPLSPTQASLLEEIMPVEDWASLFNCNSVDSLKWSSGFNKAWFFDNKGRFLHLWLELLPENLGLYCRTYISLTFGCWAPLTMISHNPDQSLFFSLISNRASQKEELLAWTGLANVQLFPEGLQSALDSFYHTYTNFPGIGLCFWFLLLSLLTALLARKRAAAFAAMPLLLNWLGFMFALSVSSAFRYFYCNALVLPLLTALLLLKEPSGEAAPGASLEAGDP